MKPRPTQLLAHRGICCCIASRFGVDIIRLRVEDSFSPPGRTARTGIKIGRWKMRNRKLEMKPSRTRYRITRSEALAFRKRWEAVNTFEKEELRVLSVDEKLGQLAMLMALAKELEWTVATDIEVSTTRDRWNKLREAYHA